MVGNTLKELLIQANVENSAGINWKAVHDNYRPLVEFMRELVTDSSLELTGEEPEYHHYLSQLKTAVELSDNQKWGRELYEELKSEPESFITINLLNWLLENWEALKNSTTTYRLLADVARVESWTDDKDAIQKYFSVMESISGEWT